MRRIRSGTSKFSEKTNIGEYCMGKSVLAITHQFMRERQRMLTNIRYSPILANAPRIGVCAVLPLYPKMLQIKGVEHKITYKKVSGRICRSPSKAEPGALSNAVKLNLLSHFCTL